STTAAGAITRKLPKAVSPEVHAILDWATFGAFFTAGALLWSRNKRASLAAYLCADVVGSLIFVSDVRGGAWKKLSFETHGRIDPGLAALAASLPELMAFAHDKESRFFRMMGVGMAMISGITDYQQGSSNLETRARVA